MPYLDPYIPTLTARAAAHLLRRATFGPTPAEITAFTGRTAAEAVQTLLTNVNYTPPQPVDLDDAQATAGKPFLQNATTLPGEYLPFVGLRNGDYSNYIMYWWQNLMIQPGPVNLLDKLTLFWQNHFVTTRSSANDYRFVWSYLQLLRTNALGNFRTLVTDITKEPAMLRFLNGDMNEVGKANENYGRELQELFTIGTVDAAGNANYTEDDVRNAARVLTGWKYSNYYKEGSTTFATTFTPTKHDSTNKTFSAKYGNTIITGRTGTTAGDLELTDLVTMLLNHPQCSRFICRKLYRWYVNDTITTDIETNVIVPLAQLFVSSDYQIQPVVVKLLTSQIFYDQANIGAMIKSPTEFVVGMVRFFQLPIAPLAVPVTAFRKTMEYLYARMRDLQLDLIEQPSVFGYEPYYQTGYSKLWSNTNTMAVRSDVSDRLTNGQQMYLTTYLDIAPLARAVALQPNFGDISVSSSVPPGTPPITCVQVLDSFLANLLATDLVQVQKDFLIDTIMMQAIPRTSWEFEWNTYRRTVTYPGSYTTSAITNAKTAVNNRLKNLLKFLLRLAEYHVF